MKATLVLMACLLTLTTSIIETTELFLTKLEARLFLLGQMLVTWDLWARRASWKITSLHMIGIAISLNLDTSVPNHAPYGFLLHSCAFLFIVIAVINTDKHMRSFSQPFTSPPPEEYIYCIEWDKLPLFAPHLFDIMELIGSDESSSEDEDHMPPNFLEEHLWENILVPTAG